MDFRILGPLEVAQDGQSLRLGGAQQRALLAVLLIHRGEVLSTDRLIDELWADRPPPTAAKTVQGYVSQLRRVLGEAAIVTRGHGYVLAVVSDEVDVARFEALLREGTTALADGDAVNAQQRLGEALALWRGEPLADFAYDSFAQAEIARLKESRLAAFEARIDAGLALGEHASLVAELEALVHQYPLRERLIAQLMLALYRSGRQAEALECYRVARSRLVEELGLDPGRELQDLEAAILAQDRRLDSPTRASARGPPRIARRRRGGLVIAAAGVVLLAAIAAAAVTLSASRSASLRVGANSLAEVDPRSNTVVEWASVGARPGAITFGSGSLWVANMDDQTVSRIDPTNLRTVRALTMGGTPTDIAASTGAIWVTESVPRASSVSVTRVDPEFNSLGRAVRIANVDPGGPASIAARGNAVWVAPSSGLLTRVDAATGRPGHAVDPNAGPAAVAVGDGAVWVTDGLADNVTRVDPTGQLTQIAVGDGPSGLAVGEGGVWVADSVDNKVTRIDPGSQSATSTIPVGRSPSGVAVGAGSIWVANSGDGTVTRINPRTDRVVARIAVGGSPQAITVADGRVWVTVDAQTIRVPAGGGTLRREIGFDFDSLDPALAYGGPSWQVLYATCAKLLNYPDASGPAGGRLVPEVAQSLPALSADGKTYRFRIRSGFRFSPPSNQPVTAETFKATIERALNPRMKAPLAYEFTDIVGARAYIAGAVPHIAGIVAEGDTLTIRLLSRKANFLSLITQPVFCAVPSNTPLKPGATPIPSAGPYYVQSYTPGQGAVLVRNPNYRGSRPRRFARIEVAERVSNTRAVADVKAGTADYTSLITSPNLTLLVSRLDARYGPGSAAAARGQQRYFHVPSYELDFLFLNTHRPLFRNARLRQAVNYAIDRRALAAHGDGFNSLPVPVNEQYLPPDMPGYRNTPIYPMTPDLAKARGLAGHKHRTAVLYTCNYPQCSQQAQIITNDLRAIGINVQAKAFAAASVGEHVNKPGASDDLAETGWSADYPDPAAMLWPILEDRTWLPTFDNASYRRRLTAAGELTGPRRLLAYGKLAVDLARNAAPLVAWGDAASPDFFSARIGCQSYGFYGLDLAALCLRHR